MKQIAVEDIQLDRVQKNIAESVDQLERIELNSGRYLKDVSIVAGTVKSINHGLGRDPLGYIVVSQDASAIMWKSISTLPDKILNLNASINVKVNLWIF